MRHCASCLQRPQERLRSGQVSLGQRTKREEYNVSQKMGKLDYRPPTYMDSEEYMDYQFKKSTKEYWKQKTHAESALKNDKPLVPKLVVGGEGFDRIFGGNTVEIRPNGSVTKVSREALSKL